MRPLLLIHGSGHGAWCWRDVLPALAARGVTARAIDLPGLGDDPTPAAEVTLETNVAAIGAALEDPAVLVGHSLAGIGITAAAHAVPERVLGLVFLAAWAPEDGESAASLRKTWGCAPLMAATIRDPGGVTTSWDPDLAPGVFYQDCPAEALAHAEPRLRPQPIAVGNTPVRTGPERGTIPRDYIVCARDNAIPPEYQAGIAATLPPGHAHRLDCGHSPFFACPGALADILATIAERK